jgi:hypothetical protein
VIERTTHGPPLLLNHLDEEGAVRADLPVVELGLVTDDNIVYTPALDDSGAGSNFITRSLAEQIGWTEDWSQRTPSVRLGDLSSIPCYGTAEFQIRLDPKQPDVLVSTRAYVVETLGFPLILGYPFGRRLKKSYEYDDKGTQIAWVTPAEEILYSRVVESIHTNAQLHHLTAQVTTDGGGVPPTIFQAHLTKEKEVSETPPSPYESMVGHAPERLKPLLLEYRDIFVRDSASPPPQGHGVVATIPTVGDEVSYTKQFPLAHKHLTELKTMLDDLIQKDWVETAHSPFNNPIFLVPKNNGKWRIVLDFRGLNSITVKDKYRLPRIDHLLNTAMSWDMISTMDLVDGFYQIPLSDRDRQKTAFTTPWGSYQWKVMPMGLCNAPAIFQGVTDALIGELQRTVGYVDDLAVGGRSSYEHDEALAALFARVRKFGLHLAPHKCHFGRQTTEFLGYMVGGGKLAPTSTKVDAVRDFPVPQTQTQLRSFLGLVGYHGRFIKDFHVLAGPLERLSGRTDKAPGWATRNWGPEEDQAFRSLKDAMVSHPVLRAPNWDNTKLQPFILSTDASGYGMGACLMQAQDPSTSDPPHPIGYWSRTFSELEQRVLATHERELCALMEGLEHFRTTILHYDLKVWCDHKPLMHLMQQPHLTAKQARWAHRIAPYLPFEFEYVPGKSPAMGPADALSRVQEHEGKAQVGSLAEVVPPLAHTITRGLLQDPHEGSEGTPVLHHLQPPGTPRFVLLLCSGRSQSVERHIRSQDPHAIIVTLDSDPACCPTICGSVLHWSLLLASAGLHGIAWDLIWASPPCAAFSQANTAGKDPGPSLMIVRAVLDCIQTLKPRRWVLENSASGPRALHRQPLMSSFECYRTETSYCRYGTLYRKATSFWTNYGQTLQAPCRPTNPCPCLFTYGRHPYTAQAGSRANGQEGMGSGRAVEGYPKALLRIILAEPLGVGAPLHHLQAEGSRAAGPGPVTALSPPRGPEVGVTPAGTGLSEALLPPEPLLQEIRRGLTRDPIWRFLRRRQRGAGAVPDDEESAERAETVGEDGHVEEEDGDVEEGEAAQPTQNAQSVWEERYEIRNGLLCLKEDGRIYVPNKQSLKDTIVQLAHGENHFGVNKTYLIVSRRMWWPSMMRDVKIRVAGCTTCQAAKVNRQARPGLLQPLPIETQAWRSVSIDWISGLPCVAERRLDRPNQGYPLGTYWVAASPQDAVTYDSIFVLTDRYSKAVRLRACSKSCTGADAVRWIKEELFRNFGWPRSLISDNDPRFHQGYRVYLEVRGTKLHFTSGYHPQANGQAERSNSTVQNVLRCVCNGLAADTNAWPDVLPDVEFAINSSPAVHGVAPYSLFLQFPPQGPLEEALGSSVEPSRVTRHDAIHGLVRKRLEEEQARQRAAFDRRHRPLSLAAGDWAYLRRSSLGIGKVLTHEDPRAHKLLPPFLGPYRVIRRKSNCEHTYVLDTRGEVRSETWHASHLLKANAAASLYEVPFCDFTPTGVLAARTDIDGHVRYLTTWAEVDDHSWELGDASGVGRTSQGRRLVHEFRRKWGRHAQATDLEDTRLVEHPEWLQEVVA